MSENQKKILQMLAEGKISVDEAQRLLSLIDSGESVKSEIKNNWDASKPKPRYLYVIVEPKEGSTAPHDRVNVRIPFGLIRAGMKLTSLIPPDAANKVDGALKEKGIDWDIRHFKEEDIQELLVALHDSDINIQTGNETVRVYAE